MAPILRFARDHTDGSIPIIGVTSVNVVEIPGWPIEVIDQAACVDMLRSGSISAASMSAKASTCM